MSNSAVRLWLGPWHKDQLVSPPRKKEIDFIQDGGKIKRQKDIYPHGDLCPFDRDKLRTVHVGSLYLSVFKYKKIR